jgi:hypothetical protein
VLASEEFLMPHRQIPAELDAVRALNSVSSLDRDARGAPEMDLFTMFQELRATIRILVAQATTAAAAEITMARMYCPWSRFRRE